MDMGMGMDTNTDQTTTRVFARRPPAILQRTLHTGMSEIIIMCAVSVVIANPK